MKTMVTELNDSNFEEFVTSSKAPVLVDFWAPWCGPCRMLSPLVDEMASRYEGQLAVAKCNVDDAEDVPAKYGIRNIPTLLFFKNGELVERTVGGMTKAELEDKIKSIL